MCLKIKENINTPEYWDNVFSREIVNKKWRRNVLTFGKIRTYLGLRVRSTDQVLDVGCGYGVLLNKLKPIGCSLIGWDISEVAINEVKRYGNSGSCIDFVDYIPSDNEQFDHVITTEFLEHVEDPDEIFNKLYSLARKTVIVAVPNNCMKDCEEHMAVFNHKSMQKLVQEYKHNKLSIENYLDEFVYKDELDNDVLSSRPTLLMILEKI